MARELDPRAIAVWTRYREILNRSELARRLGLSPVSVHNWKAVPITRLDAVSAATGIPAELLRPDLFPADTPWETL